MKEENTYQTTSLQLYVNTLYVHCKTDIIEIHFSECDISFHAWFKFTAASNTKYVPYSNKKSLIIVDGEKLTINLTKQLTRCISDIS